MLSAAPNCRGYEGDSVVKNPWGNHLDDFVDQRRYQSQPSDLVLHTHVNTPQKLNYFGCLDADQVPKLGLSNLLVINYLAGVWSYFDGDRLSSARWDMGYKSMK